MGDSDLLSLQTVQEHNTSNGKKSKNSIILLIITYE